MPSRRSVRVLSSAWLTLAASPMLVVCAAARDEPARSRIMAMPNDFLNMRGSRNAEPLCIPLPGSLDRSGHEAHASRSPGAADAAKPRKGVHFLGVAILNEAQNGGGVGGGVPWL